MVAAAKAGATYGLPILWAGLLGAILTFALAEGVARWQLAAAYARAGQPDAGEDLARGLAFRMTHDGGQDPTFGSALRNTW